MTGHVSRELKTVDTIIKGLQSRILALGPGKSSSTTDNVIVVLNVRKINTYTKRVMRVLGRSSLQWDDGEYDTV